MNVKISNRAKCIAIALSLCASARAQQAQQRIDRTQFGIQRDTQNQIDTELPLSQRALIDYGAYATYNYLSFDDSAHNNHGLNGFDLVGYGQVNFDSANDLYVRARGTYLGYNPGDNPQNRPNQLEGEIEEGWYHFDLANAAENLHHQKPLLDIDVKGGRQFVDWGEGLTLDQYADGVLASFKSKPVIVDLLAAVTIRQTVDFDISRPNLDSHTERGFYGVKATVPVGRANPYGYILFQRDYNPPEPGNSNLYTTRYRYNSYYAGLGINGPIRDQFLYAAEGTFEGGRGLSNSYDPVSNLAVRQTADPIEAYAAKARIEYLPGDAHRSRLAVEGIIASGDRDRVNTSGTFGGNTPNTGDHAFNALGDSDTGLAFAAPVSNLMLVRVGASTYPFTRKGFFSEFQTGIDTFVFGKTLVHAPIDEPTLNKGYMGFEPDLFINWRPVNDVTFIFRYGVFVPGNAIPSGQPNFVRQFLYAGVTYAL